MLGGTSGKLQVSPTYCKEMGKADLMLLNEMLDRIQNLGISDDQTSVYDRIGDKSRGAGIFVPPATHLVATIEDLTDILDNASDEAVDIYEDANDMSYTASPLATSNTGKWAATSTYDVYMVDTPKGDEGGKEPPNADADGVMVKAQATGMPVMMPPITVTLLTTTLL